jgi:hypothetical protein
VVQRAAAASLAAIWVTASAAPALASTQGTVLLDELLANPKAKVRCQPAQGPSGGWSTICSKCVTGTT